MMPLLVVLLVLGFGLGLLVSWRRAQRRAAELQESKARLEEAQRVAHVGHWEWNLETNANIWSAETYRIYGLAPREGPIDIAAIGDMIHPDDRAFVFQAAEDALRSGVRPEAEHRIVRPTGSRTGQVSADNRSCFGQSIPLEDMFSEFLLERISKFPGQFFGAGHQKLDAGKLFGLGPLQISS